MDNNNDLNQDRWVNDRLASLSPDHEWQPNLQRGLARLQERRNAQRGSDRSWGWVAAGIVAAGLPLMALPATRVIAHRCVSACVEQSGRLRALLRGNVASPAGSSTYLENEDRRVAPDFAMTDASGKQFNLSDFRGKIVLLNFWATWCAPCKAEIPMFDGLQQTYQGHNFTVLGVSLEEDGWNLVKPFMATARFNYPVMVGPEDVAALYGGLDAVPTTLLIDKSGRIAALHVGLCSRSEYEADINALLQKQ